MAILVAILAPVLIGAVGLGAESSYWYLTQRQLQNAADSAAHGAGRMLLAGENADLTRQTAAYLVAESGVVSADAAIAINTPPASGAYMGDTNAVEAVVTRAVPRLFTAIYDSEPVPISARAVAAIQPGASGCVLALSATEEGAITVTGSSDSTLSLCDLVSNAAGQAFIMSGGGSSVSANCIQTVGTAVVTSNLTVNCKTLREHAAAISDPFAGVEEPALTGACQSGDVGKNNETTPVAAIEAHASGMNSKRYCNGLNLRGTVNFAPGLYMIEGGPFSINSNATVTGDGVAFFLVDGVAMQFNGTASLDLSAPDSGPYAGIVIFGSRGATTVSHTINGNLGSTLDGAIYTPSSHVTLSGSAKTASHGCTQFVSNTIEFTGSGTIDISCENTAGPKIEVPGSVTLVE